ncbi:AP-3 complex subunit delta [Phanerochaete sordida]|uniref:AP-3 complex subunit delta n=1 Tax=Phanerochaete sordida TaxID=48140 RepID=A0A9P3G736_9APHY|nr:AP-3 complex subunit delta [Phanerochaete sordida]
MWERTLQDLIRGLRANKKDEAKFIAQAVEEIRQETRSKDMELKAAAVLKLTYLDMLGYDMSWASFHVVEVMSSPKIHLKTIGYLAATQSFNQDTDVLMLTTNLLKKDFASKPEDVAVTLNGFSHIVTPDLARDLGPDVIKMLTHSRAHIRKRAVLAMFNVLDKYPELTPQAMTRLRERLDDPDPAVVTASVNVICELARRNPRDYLPLAPQLFHLLTTSSNNWMLIKIIKLFGTLTPHEPRLVKKLQPPITDLISTTPAISLLYECVHTCIIGGMLQGLSGHSLARTCVTKLANFLQDDDQNLKYIALLAMAKIVPTHPHLVAEHQGMIMSSVNDQDISIRMRALDLISAMANRDNLQSIVQQLLSHLVRNDNALPSAAQSLAQHTQPPASVTRVGSPSQNPAYRLILAQRILTLCSQDTYEFVTDFEWYLSVLVDLAYVANVDVGAQICEQLMDVTARVRAARPYAVQLMAKLLNDDSFLVNADDDSSCAQALWAAAWICGEHCSELADPQKLLEPLLRPEVFRLAPETIAVYLQAAVKVFGAWAADLADDWNDEELPRVRGVVDTMIERVGAFAAHADIEVQERAANFLQLLAFVRADVSSFQPKPAANGLDYAADEGFGAAPADDEAPRFPKGLYLVRPLFATHELNPVAPVAQSHVLVPEGLDLNAWIVPPPAEETVEGIDGEEEPVRKKKGKGKEREGTKGKKKKRRDGEDVPGEVLAPTQEETEEERAQRERRKAERLERQRDDPFYLADDRSSARAPAEDVDAIPVVRLDDLPPLPQSSAGSRLPSLRSTPRATTPQAFVVDRVGEMPDFMRAKSQTPPIPAPANGNGAAAADTPVWEPSHGADVAAPAPITVTRVKKKKRTGETSKKKRTTASAEP